MSIILKCDICGKSSEEISFSSTPITIIKENYNEEKFRIYLNIEIENNKDHESNKRWNEIQDESDLVEDIFENGELHIETPDPFICEKCKNEVLYKFLEGFYQKDKEYFDGESGTYIYVDQKNPKAIMMRKNVKNDKEKK